jgi:hypothetical protein
MMIWAVAVAAPVAMTGGVLRQRHETSRASAAVGRRIAVQDLVALAREGAFSALLKPDTERLGEASAENGIVEYLKTVV